MFLSLRQCPVSGVWSLQTQVSVQLGCPFSPAHRERDRGGGGESEQASRGSAASAHTGDLTSLIFLARGDHSLNHGSASCAHDGALPGKRKPL